MSLEIGAHKGLKSAAANNRLESRKVFLEGGKQTEPVLPVINLQSLERSKPVIGTNERVGFISDRGTRLVALTHLFAASERAHNGSSHTPLKTIEIRIDHAVTARGAAAPYDCK